MFGLGEDSDIGHYNASVSKVAALGPISEAELAARLARLAAMRVALAAETAVALDSGEGGMEMMLVQGPTSTCNTNSPLSITNTVCAWVTNQGWTVTFDIQGTNGPADIFTTTALGTTNAWTWLERGPACYTYQYTNQPGPNACYILGTEEQRQRPADRRLRTLGFQDANKCVFQSGHGRRWGGRCRRVVCLSHGPDTHGGPGDGPPN
jgi:hypothetical protein